MLVGGEQLQQFFHDSIRKGFRTQYGYQQNAAMDLEHELAAVHIARVLDRFHLSRALTYEPGMSQRLPWVTSMLYAIAEEPDHHKAARLTERLSQLSLFMSGVFPEHLRRNRVEKLYRHQGSTAYACLGDMQENPCYRFLGNHFDECANIIQQTRDEALHLRREHGGTYANRLTGRGYEVGGKIKWEFETPNYDLRISSATQKQPN